MSAEQRKDRDGSGDAPVGAGGLRGGWLAALIVSLALNMLFVGAFVGAWWQRAHAPEGIATMMRGAPPSVSRRWRGRPLLRPGVLEMRAVRRLLRTLPKERRRELHRLLRRGRPDVRRSIRTMRAARLRFIKALRQAPENSEAALNAWRTMVDEQERLLRWQRATLERFLRALTPEERQRYVQILARLQR